MADDGCDRAIGRAGGCRHLAPPGDALVRAHFDEQILAPSGHADADQPWHKLGDLHSWRPWTLAARSGLSVKANLWQADPAHLDRGQGPLDRRTTIREAIMMR